MSQMGSDYEYPGLPKYFLNIFSSVVEKYVRCMEGCILAGRSMAR